MIKIHNILLNYFGPQGWWPTINKKTGKCEYHKNNYKIPETEEQKLQVILGAILTQNTSWKNVENAIINLGKNHLINLNAISTITQEKLAEIIRSSGYHNQKSERLKIFCNYLIKNNDGNISRFFDKEISDLREELLSIKGIGPETADSIILYAAQKPIFVVDTYTKRFFSRFGLCSVDISYDALQNMIHEELKNEISKVYLFNEFHALIVEFGKNFCKIKPLCNDCPVNNLCQKRIQ